MGFVVAVVVLLFLVMCVLTFIVFAKPDLLNKNKDKNGNVISSDDLGSSPIGKGESIGDTKSFIPIKGFDTYAVDLGNYNYRAYIECTSVNYSLMSEQEQNMIEVSYMRFLNSLNFPVSIYIQTREYDNDIMLERLDKNIQKAQKRFPSIKDYADRYKEEMKYLTQYIGNSKIKKKFIIVPYNNTELQDVSALSKQEIKEFILEELFNRCNIIKSGIEGVGLSTRLLESTEIAECLYSFYHRDMYRIASDIIKGEYTTLAINAEEEIDITDRKELDLILTSAQNRIVNDLARKNPSAEETLFYQYLFNVLEQFKQDAQAEDIVTLLQNTKEQAIENGYGTEYTAFLKDHPEAADILKRREEEDSLEEDTDVLKKDSDKENGKITPVFPEVHKNVAVPVPEPSTEAPTEKKRKKRK